MAEPAAPKLAWELAQELGIGGSKEDVIALQPKGLPEVQEVIDNALYDAVSTPPVKSERGQFLDNRMYTVSKVHIDTDLFWELPSGFTEKAAKNDPSFFLRSEKILFGNPLKLRYHRISAKNTVRLDGAPNKLPGVLFIHGVPTNADQYLELLRITGPFVDAVAVDLLGMGKSSKPIRYPWSWADDAEYFAAFIEHIWGKGVKIHLVADDWGGAPAVKLAAKFGATHLKSLSLISPITGDGHPVPEITDIGMASLLNKKENSGLPGEDPIVSRSYMRTMGGFPGNLNQIIKSMLYSGNPHSQKLNQYAWRTFLETYADQDYERPADSVHADPHTGAGYSSLTGGIKWRALRVLSERAAILAPNRIFPWHAKKNPIGIRYSNIRVPVMILWGQYDNMMPAAQRHRMRLLFAAAPIVQAVLIPNAGHLGAVDQPEFVAEELMDWWVNAENLETIFSANIPERVTQRGPARFGALLLGFSGDVGKGDEEFVQKSLRDNVYHASKFFM